MNFCKITVIAAFVLLGSLPSAWAGETLDIVGITAGLSPGEAESVLTNAGFEFTKSDIVTITGTEISWTQQSYYSRNRDGDGVETLTVYYTSPPSEPGVMQVKRDWQRTSESIVPFPTMISSLIGKYGEPVARRDARSGSTLFWHVNPTGPSCTQHKSAGALVSTSIAEVKRGGPAVALSCPGVVVDYNVQFSNSAAGPVVSRMIASLFDVSARAVDEAKLNAYATEILRKKQEEQMKGSVSPEL